MSACCHYCGESVNPAERTTLQRIVAWERRAVGDSRKSGRDILLREHREEYAHSHCVERLKLGVPIQQGSLLG